ncbi:SWI/SNF subfamily A-like protein [Sarcoptes scabiei]|nr:SWI/SNF subfamily A-like protein [Sarcoptes scabiei]
MKFDYETKIINVLKNFSSKQWDPISKKWSLSIEDYTEIINRLKSIESKDIEIKYENLIPDLVIKAIADNAARSKKIDLSEKFDSEFIKTLYPYQREGIIFGIQREGRCLIADDMGLGKTIQAIGLAIWYRDDWPLIIVCPSSLRFQWANFILKWAPNINEEDIFVATNTKNLLPKVLITIISYDLMARTRSRFSVETNRYYNMIIMDESHYVKSDVAHRTSVASLIAQTCKRVVLLSGTPALSRPIELFPQLNIIDRNLFPTKHGFGIRYCDAQQKAIFRNRKRILVWDYKGAKNLEELKIILENTIMIRRLKKEVLNELPSKKREMICISTDHLATEERNLLMKFKSQIKNTKNPNDKKSAAFSLFAKSAEAKVEAVNEYLIDILKNDFKIIVFCHHKSMMDGVEEILNKEKINHIRIDGNTSPKVRQEACEVFQTKDSFRVALLSITACATGLNLTAASMVVFAEVFWNPGVLAQAEDRVHRIGQQDNVRVIYLVARGTIDEIIWPLISKKLDVLNKAGLSRDTFSDTHNPLDNDENQQLLTEFYNIIDREDLESRKNNISK